MIKKRISLVLSMLVVIMLAAACSSSTTSKEEKEKETGKNENASVEIKVDNAEYTLPSEYDNVTEDQLVLKIDVEMTNKRKETIDIEPPSFALYQGDTKATEGEPEDYKQKLEYTRLTEGKKIKGSLFYIVDKGEQYQLVYTPLAYGDKEEDPIEIEIDGADEKLIKTADKLQDPAKALSAYLDILFYNVDNPRFEKLTGEKKDALLEEFDAAIIEGFSSATYMSEDQLDQKVVVSLVNSMKSAFKEKVGATTITKTSNGKEAIVELKGKPLDVPSLQPILEQEMEKFITSNPNATEAEALNFVFEKMGNEFKNVTTAEEVIVEIQMVKHGEDQWKIDPDDYRSEDIATPFVKFY
ncbi:DUF5105 domain-containing protein [Metabacillus halosaccharovorans]|uniref:DUF5105 domain-containing protein n=1 Tax=Metabacillus halosaccharovorans TaxID=930124 RepID=UPI00403D688F